MKTRADIYIEVERLWHECQDRNIGSNEAELDFLETISDWIYNRG